MSRHPHQSCLLSLVLIAGTAVCSGTPAVAQVEKPPAATFSPSLLFDTRDLPLQSIPGSIRFQADRAWTWREGNTHRIVLERDAIIELGASQFQASRAVIWLREIGHGGADRSYQVFAYLEDVRTPAADAAVSVEADQLPIRAVIRGIPKLAADLRLAGPPTPQSKPTPERNTFDAMESASQALSSAFTNRPDRPTSPGDDGPAIPVIDPGQPKPDQPTIEPVEPADPDQPITPPIEPERALKPGEPPASPVDVAPDVATDIAPTRSPIFRAEGLFFVAAGDRVVMQSGEFDNAVVITGGVVLQYQNDAESLELTAERGVIFLKPGRLTDQLSAFSADDVIGVYLEGEVRATNGQYTVRGPRIYYDVAADRALILDAVFWAYEQRLRMPLYMRADAIRQEAGNQFSAEKASLSNTAFFHPDFTIGTSSVTITQTENDEGESKVTMDARHITIRAGDIPFFWWPRYKGDPERIPIRNIGFKDSNRTGAVIQTKWDAFSLLGIQPLNGLDATLIFDHYSDRGFGIGVDASWGSDTSAGDLYAYGLPEDDGTDIVARRVEIERDREARSMAFFRHREELPDGWTVLFEASYASDEAFIPALFPEIGRETRELTTRVFARRNSENTQFSLEAKGSLNDFIIPEHQLQAPGYLVDKLPELKYTAIGSDILSETFPGLLSHTWDATYSQMRFRFSEVDASTLGFDRDHAAQRAFGTDADQSLGDLYRSMGLNESMVNRFDTRHEISAQLKAGEVFITPFAIGRVTVYDDAFTGFSPAESDQVRLWGGVGTTLATSFHRTYSDTQSTLLDIHGIRHIIEPSITVFHADTTIDRVDLPVFDDEVESILEGTSVNLRLANTWQTKRGGPGRWRSVDLLRANIEYVWHGNDTGRESPIGRYYAARPELSVPGEYFRFDSTLQLTEALAIAGETIYDLEINQQARSSIGALVEHTPDFLSTAELRYINSQDVTYGRLGFLYTLTNKYRMALNTTYNFDKEDFQNINARIYRKFTIGEVGLGIRYDNIRGETSFGITFTPIGNPGGRIGGPVNSSSDFQDSFGS